MESKELWDAYYPDGTLAGVDLVRGEKIPAEYRHAVVDIFVMHQDGTILLTRRDWNKPNGAGKLESGAGGSVLKGESYLEAAARELKEETGIESTYFEQMYYVVTDDTIYRGYLCTTMIAKDSIVLQPGETIEYRWVTKPEYIRLWKNGEMTRGKQKRLEEFIRHDFRLEADCCFAREKEWFRYRAAGIIIEEGHLLMAQGGAADYYYSIGGGVHMGETSEEAVLREVLEETGVPYEIDRLACINESFFPGDGNLTGYHCHVIEFYYLMKPRHTREGIAITSTSQGMEEKLCWLPIDDLDQYEIYPLFYRKHIKNLPEHVLHIISDERREKR